MGAHGKYREAQERPPISHQDRVLFALREVARMVGMMDKYPHEQIWRTAAISRWRELRDIEDAAPRARGPASDASTERVR